MKGKTGLEDTDGRGLGVGTLDLFGSQTVSPEQGPFQLGGFARCRVQFSLALDLLGVELLRLSMIVE